MGLYKIRYDYYGNKTGTSALNMATFKQRESGWWQAVIRRKGHPPQSHSFQFKDDAKMWARDIENKMDRGIFQDRSKAEDTTLGELIDCFIKEFAELQKNYRQREDKKEAWRYQCAHLKNLMGRYSLAAIGQELIEKYRDDRQKLVSESTVRKELYMLSKLMGFAVKEKRITLPRGNPVMSITMPLDGKPRARRLSEEELGRLEKECRVSRNSYLWPAVELALESSARQGELLDLSWENVDLLKRTAFLEETKNGESRTVPLSPRAIAVLKGLPHSIRGAVIPVQRMTLYHAFKAAVKRAGIKDFTFHDLRHEGLSRLAERGDFSLLEMAAVSGHKTLQVLKKIYVHLEAENLAKKLAS